MRFTLTVDMDNAAFEDPDELRRILRHVADEVDGFDNGGETYEEKALVRDVNGNTVGHWEITDD